MKITVNGNPCEIKPTIANLRNNQNGRECTLTIRCYANKSFTSYEREKICDAVEELLKQEVSYADRN